MVHIPGISIQKNVAGKITHIVIDIEQEKELAQPVLERLGVAEDYDFNTAFANGQTLEESEAIVVSEIKENYIKQRRSRIEDSLSLEESLQSTLQLIDRLFDEKGKN